MALKSRLFAVPLALAYGVGTDAPESPNTLARGGYVDAQDAAMLASAQGYTDAETDRALAAEALLAPKASPALTGTPTAPTAAALTNNTQIATTAYADAAVDVEKQRALAAEGLLAPLNSPALTGAPTAPTAIAGDASTQVATTAFVMSAVGTAVGGVDWKSVVKFATTADLGFMVQGNSLVAPDNLDRVIDGQSVIALPIGTRILVKDQVQTEQGGIYVLASLNPIKLDRAADMDAGNEFNKMTLVPVQQGAANGGKWFYLSATGADPFVVGTSSEAWTEFKIGNEFTASQGVKLNGFDFELDLEAAGGLKLNGNQVGLKLAVGSDLSVDANGLTISSVEAAKIKGNFAGTNGAPIQAGVDYLIPHGTGYSKGLLQVVDSATLEPVDVAWQLVDGANFKVNAGADYAAGALTFLFYGIAA